MSITHVTPTGLVGAEEWTAEHTVSLTAADVGAAETVHTHDAYSGTAHTHAIYSGTAHNHTGVYATADHSHPGGSEAFPVGSVFIGVVSTNPATLLGYGTWSAFGAGRVLVGLDSGDTDFDTVKETGGAKTKAISAHADTAVADHAAHTHDYSTVLNHTHTVTVTDPGHAHTQTTSATDGATTRADASSGGTTYNNVANINSNTTGITASTANPAGASASGTTTNPSATLTHSVTQPSAHTDLNVVQPYIVVYMWERTA